MKNFFEKIQHTGTISTIILLMLFLFVEITGCNANSGNSAEIASETEISESKEFSNETIADTPKSDSTDNHSDESPSISSNTGSSTSIEKDEVYTSKDDVALYLYTYGTLPDNFITKKEAQSLGWSGGSLEPYAPGKCIGGDYFGNYEGLLPERNGRDYHECDIDTLGQNSRGAKRIIYSNDGLIYYTDDHYESFELLYGEE